MITKVCTDCKQAKSLDEFARHPRAGHQCRCKPCQRIKSKDWYSNNKERQKANAMRNARITRKAFSEWKRSLSCSVCSESFHACLDFHHLGDKDSEISKLICNVGIDRVVEELNKCVVLCANCHRKVHAGVLSIADIPPIVVTKETICP